MYGPSLVHSYLIVNRLLGIVVHHNSATRLLVFIQLLYGTDKPDCCDRCMHNDKFLKAFLLADTLQSVKFYCHHKSEPTEVHTQLWVLVSHK